MKKEISRLEYIEKSLEQEFYSFDLDADKRFFGREKEKGYLKKWHQNTIREGVLIAVHGIRRGGKTYLIKKFIEEKLNEKENRVSLNLLGDYKKTEEENLMASVIQIENLFKEKAPNYFQQYKDFLKEKSWYYDNGKGRWLVFFTYLTEVLNKIGKEIEVFIFFDEVAWFSKNDNFVNEFSYFWNQYCSMRQKTMVFVASSSKSWIESRFFKDSKGLFKRISGKIEVKPFTLSEMIAIFKEMHWIKDKKEILKYYLIFGGFIKHYLEIMVEIDFRFPLNKNFKKLQENRFYFLEEYDAMFRGVLSEKRQYKEIVKIVSDKGTASAKKVKEGLSKKISEDYVRKQLKEMKGEGFLNSFEDKKEENFFVSVPLMFFVNKWKEDDFDLLLKTGAYYVWQGRSFELFLANNIDKVMENLNIKGKYSLFINKMIKENDFGEKTNKILAQIDLLLTREEKRKSKIRNREFVFFECKFFESEAEWSNESKKAIKRKLTYLKELYIARDDNFNALNEVDVNYYVLSTVDDKNVVNVLDWF